MQKNRLKLDWALNSSEERAQFIDTYINEFQKKYIPTPEELETIANYILWGKDSDGQSLTQKGDIEIESRNKTWTKTEIASLDEALESPTFNEAALRPYATPFKAPKETFSRTQALSLAPPSLHQSLLELFSQIDSIDLEIQFYELAHQKRKTPIRKELLSRFSEAQLAQIQTRANSLNQYTYLKQRHLLVELRRQQYTIRDSFSQPITRHCPPEPWSESTQEPLSVRPLGVISPNTSFLFSDEWPPTLTPTETRIASKTLWECRESSPGFNFRDPENLYQLIQLYEELQESNPSLIETFQYYTKMAELNEVYKEVLDFKIKKVQNQDIADKINRTYGKNYTANYISTIFKQKVLSKIGEAAALHERVIENIFFEEEFKRCNTCGKLYLRDSAFFTKKTKSTDGFAGRCKKCDKLVRLGVIEKKRR